MSPNRLLTAAAALALATVPMTAAAQGAAQPTTEAAARAATGKPTSDAPAATQVQGTAKAVKEAAPAAASAAQPAATQAPAAEAAAPAAPAAAAPSTAKPVVVNGDLVDTLKLSGQFTHFVAGIDSTNLAGLLKTNKNLTVFAPTDGAFAALPPAELQQLKSDKTAMQKFVLRHVINAPIDAAKIKGARGPVPTGSQEQVLLDGSDESGVLKVGGANIVQADLKTGSGLLHVIDKVLTPGAGDAAPAPAAAAPSAGGAATPSSATSGTNTAPKQ